MNNELKLTNLVHSLTLILMGLSGQMALAQGTLRFDFRGLPPGQFLEEQFGGSGVHFFRMPSGAAATTVRSPGNLSGAGETVGTAVAFGMGFDQPISSLAFDIAEVRGQFEPPGSAPVYHIEGYNSAGAAVVPQGRQFTFDAWHRAAATYAMDQDVTSAIIIGFAGEGENFTHQFFFRDLEITFIPEPGILSVVFLGAALISYFRRLGRKGSEKVFFEQSQP